MKKVLYVDNAAATPTDPRVIRIVADASRIIGNPSAFNDAGRQAGELLREARKDIARFLNAHESEIILCSSGSEANNLALNGARTILTQPTEHPSILKAAGKRARMVKVDR